MALTKDAPDRLALVVTVLGHRHSRTQAQALCLQLLTSPDGPDLHPLPFSLSIPQRSEELGRWRDSSVFSKQLLGIVCSGKMKEVLQKPFLREPWGASLPFQPEEQHQRCGSPRALPPPTVTCGDRSRPGSARDGGEQRLRSGPPLPPAPRGPIPALPASGSAELLGGVTAAPSGLGSAVVGVPQPHSSLSSSQSGWPSQRQS